MKSKINKMIHLLQNVNTYFDRWYSQGNKNGWYFEIFSDLTKRGKKRIKDKAINLW